MASPKYLSDEDLRKELVNYGITAPVTAGTRSILIKKLAQAKQNKRKVVKNSRSAKNSVGATVTSGTKSTGGGFSGASRLNTFSSDEDDDSQSEEPVRREARGTSNTSVSNRSRLSRNSFGKTNSVNHFEKNKTLAKQKTITPYVTISSRSGLNSRVNVSRLQDEYETGSDSEGVENDTVDYDDTSISTNGQESFNHNDTNNYDSVFENSGDKSNLNTSRLSNSNNHSNNHSNSNSPRYRPTTRTVPNSLRYRNSDRKRKTLPSDTEDPDLDYQSGNGDIQSDSRLRLPESADVIVTQVPFDQDQDIEVRLANGQSHQDSELSDDSRHEENIWLHSVPKVLLVLLFVFFAVVGIFYINMHKPLLPIIFSLPSLALEGLVYVASLPLPFLSAATANWKFPQLADQSTTTSSGNKFPVCENDIIKIDCLSVKELSSASGLLGNLQSLLLPTLVAHAEQHACGYQEHVYMNILQLGQLLQPKTKMESSELDVGIRGLGKLMDLNPHWGIVTKRDGELLIGLAAAQYPTQYVCHLKNKIAALAYWVLAVVLSAFLMWLSYVTYRHYKLKSDAEKQQVMELVDQILNVLGGLGNGPGGPGKDYVALNHVRDSLIAPRDRKTKNKIWDKAVKFINDNESRVRRDIESVGGEDTDVWRWVSAIPSSPSAHSSGAAAGPRPLAKTWQGQAFESLETTHNLPHISPTSSLKIRNMFDCEVEFGDTWPQRIQDSILEKCSGVSIVHVAVDRGSREGCVYLKCATPKEAGTAFRALHGWWFDGNLVTVKFLRDERYHQRFPKAQFATHPLKPSNNKRLSLQTAESSRLYPSLSHLEDQT